MSDIENRIRDRVERLWDMAPASLDTPEAWATWKRRCVSEVADIVAEETKRDDAPMLARVQPCGCIVCYCEGQERCNGCGAKNCAKHVGNAAAMDPAAVWVRHPLLARAETAEGRIEELGAALARLADSYSPIECRDGLDRETEICGCCGYGWKGGACESQPGECPVHDARSLLAKKVQS